MGTLGFLLPFRTSISETPHQYRAYDTPDIDDFAKALDTVFEGKATILNRMRLSCTFYDSELGKAGTDEEGRSPLITL